MSITTFPKISASLTGAILQHPNKHESHFKMVGKAFPLPSELLPKIIDYVSNNDKLKALQQRSPETFQEFIQLRNMFRIFGKISPTFDTANGALKLMYAPMINTPTDKIKEEIGDCDLIIKFGELCLPLVWDEEVEKFVTENNGVKLVVKPSKTKVTTQSGDIEIAIGECRINGSEKSTDRFYCRVGVKRDEKDKTKDVANGSQIEQWMENNNIGELVKVISNPTTGGTGWTNRWSDDKFQFGKYPVVSLTKEKRQVGKKTWFNLCVVVIGQDGQNNKMLLDSKYNTIWNTLTNFYPYIDENNVEHQPDDFLGFDGDKQDYAIVYSGKRKFFKEENGERKEYYDVTLDFTASPIRQFQPLSQAELESMGGGNVVTAGTTIKTPEIIHPGVDDLFQPEKAEEELIPF